MKAIILLITLVSVNVIAGTFEIEHKQLLAEQQRAAMVANPDYQQAIISYREVLKEVERLDSKLARLERTKAGLCEHGLLVTLERREEDIKSCKASNRYTEESYKVDSQIAEVSDKLEVAIIKASYHFAKAKSLAKK